MALTTPANVPPDSFDCRDLVYAPALQPLRRAYYPPTGDKPPDPSVLAGLVRTQGEDGSCTGQALAALIDLLRLQEDGRPQPPVSAPMLFEMARQLAAGEDDADGEIHSLRPVVKAFYHNGVCREDEWPAAAGTPDRELTLARARSARNVTLGAYYRVRPLLNDFHAALNEVGGLYVSAAIHPGWARERLAGNGGRIEPEIGQGAGHAFVLVGYTAEGFLVLNSWGPDWGGFEGLPGVALWRYQDWADSIYDAWVLRLAVPAPGAFDYCRGEQGLGLRGAVSLRASPPRSDVLGHYQHLDDGRLVLTGAYPSPPAGLAETLSYLADSDYRRVLLGFTHGQEDLPAAMARLARSREAWKRRGVYPFALIFANELLAPALAGWRAVAKDVDRRRDDGWLVRTLAQRLRGPIRAVWRDMVGAAARAASKGGAGWEILTPLLTLCQARGVELHVLAEGEGALLLAALLGRGTPASRQALVAAIRTLTLVGPVIEATAAARAFGPLLTALTAKGDRPGGPRAVLFRLGPTGELAAATGEERFPWPELVASVLTGTPARPAGLLGQGGQTDGALWRIETVPAVWPDGDGWPTPFPFGAAAVCDSVTRRIGCAGFRPCPGRADGET